MLEIKVNMTESFDI